MTGEPDVQVQPEQACARCGGDVLLSVTVPVSTTRADGEIVDGWRRVALCPQCDAHHDDRHTQGLLAFFAAREKITPETVQEAIPLLRQWVQQQVQHPPEYGEDELDEDIRRWRDGEL